MNKWGCFVVAVIIVFALIYGGVITTDMLIEWSDIALTWLIEALSSLRDYLRAL